MQNSQKDLYKKLLGRTGELKAEKYLKKKGYKILGKNLKNKFAEVDILAFKDKTYWFCEVKTRSGTEYGSPSLAVNYKKQEKYRSFANLYMATNGLEQDIGFLIVEIVGEDINLLVNAF